MEKKTLILIDGHALAYRQYFALERTGMKNSENQPTWAVYGFFKSIFDLLSKIKPDSMAVAFDVGRQTFRVAEYSEYKANREAMPDSLRTQLGFICEGLKAFDIPIYTKEGFEADDVIGTIASRACQKNYNVLILTGDQDSFQLIDKEGCIKVLIPSKGELIEYDWERVYEKLGVYPNQVIDYKGLRGDTSDNIPGIKGIGEKTAQKLLNRYPNLEEVLADCENIPEKAVKEKLCSQKDVAVLSKKLATIVRDVDINFDYDKGNVVLPDIKEVSKFLKQMQFYTFIKNINKILSSFTGETQSNLSLFTVSEKENTSTPQSSIQLGMFSEAIKSTDDVAVEYNLITSTSQAEDLAKKLSNQSLIAVDINFSEDKIQYIAISTGEQYVIPSEYINYFKPLLENQEIKKCFYDLKKIYKILKHNDIGLKGLYYDILLASYVKDPNRNHTIEAQALDFLDHIFTTSTVINEKIADTVGTTLKLTKYWENNLDKDEKELLLNVEVPLSIVLAKMEETGVAINIDYLNELSAYMTEKLSDLEDFIYQLAGEPFNINSPKQVAEVLYDKLGIKSKKKTSRSTSAEILEDLAQEYEICDYILQHRKFAKLKSTYTDVLPMLIDKVDERIHTSYNQTVTVTGRLSSSNPNLQNIPIRSEEGNKIRNAFCAKDKENYLILSADYSQIELRLLAHVSEDEALIEAFNTNIDVHTLTASKVFNVPTQEVTKDMRRKAKAVNFGIVYGQSKYGLAKNLEISPAQAGEFIDKYFLSYPKIKDYMQKEIDFVNENEYVETMFGRKRYLTSELSSSNFQIREFARRAAINQPLQGSAADLIKMAMIDIDKKLTDGNYKSKMILQVHDELVFEVYKPELEKLKKMVIEAMELGQTLKVPLVVDVNYGETWKE